MELDRLVLEELEAEVRLLLVVLELVLDVEVVPVAVVAEPEVTAVVV